MVEMWKFLPLCCLLFIHQSNAAYILDKMPCVVDKLWTDVNENWIVTTGSYIARFFTRYGKKPKANLSLFEHDFTTGDTNFVKDFKDCGMTTRFARAYFQSLDMKDSWIFLQLTIEDMDLMVDASDRHTDNIGLGFITASQFKRGLKEMVFRSLPLSLMFVEHVGQSMRYFRINMERDVFNNIHNKMDRSHDGRVTRTDMGKFWKEYDRSQRGKELFDKLDYRKLKYINITHWEEVFDDLDCIPSSSDHPDGKISHIEFIELDRILHGEREYPSKRPCKRDELRK